MSPKLPNRAGKQQGRRAVVSVLLGILLLLPGVLWADQATVHRFLNILEYVGADYAVAVKDGRVINEAEYAEQIDFVDVALIMVPALGIGSKDADLTESLETGLVDLRRAIEAKAPVPDIAARCQRLKRVVVERLAVNTGPPGPPSYPTGRAFYQMACAECHGALGDANTTRAKQLDPPPAAFRDPDTAANLSPYRIQNIARFGVDGTAMASFEGTFTPQELWDIAFYVASLRHTERHAQAGAPVIERLGDPRITALSRLGSQTDGEALTDFAARGLSRHDSEQALAYVRRLAPYQEFSPYAVTRQYLALVEDLAEQGMLGPALNVAVDAYLLGFEPAGMALRAHDPQLVSDVETAFMTLRQDLREGADVPVIKRQLAVIYGLLDEAEQRQATSASTPAVAFFASASIIVREGLEAVLIIAAILAFLRKSDAPASTRRRVHVGWIAALVAGGLTWLAADTIITISGAQRELLEGLVALLAAGVLFFVSYWLLEKIYVDRWIGYIQKKVEGSLTGGRAATLFFLSFLAVYRESFETVLFYQALLLPEDAHFGGILAGFLSGTAVLAFLVLLIFRYGVKIPMNWFFGITSGLLYLLSFVLAGQGVRELQEGGYLAATPLGDVQIDMLGVFPTVEGLAVQSVLVMAAAFAAVYTFVIAPRQQRRAVWSQAEHIQGDLAHVHAMVERLKGQVVALKLQKDGLAPDQLHGLGAAVGALDNEVHELIEHMDALGAEVTPGSREALLPKSEPAKE